MLNLCLSAICILNVGSLLLFLYGFFPRQSKIGVDLAAPIDSVSFDEEDGYDTCADLVRWRSSQSETAKPIVDNVVLIVIDALRYDFIITETGRLNGRMRFLTHLVDSGGGVTLEALVQPPTVTMPRIKAITAGLVPAFADIVLNFASTAFTDDNIISAAKNGGRRLLFYGDDTWLKLFPAHFQAVDGVTSFVVSDYIEVDSNVTRHLPKALQSSNEWDLMVLHYIGLDHIGHFAGPMSPLISTKLEEMDNVLRKIYTGLKEKRRTFTIIVLGDHGMTDVGSHGGASHQETTVPIVFIRSNGSGHPLGDSAFIKKAQQVDLTPTLAALLGLPIPVNNVGIVLSTVIDWNQPLSYRRHQASDLYLLRRNALQILRLYWRNAASQERIDAIGRYTALSKDYRLWLDTEFCQRLRDDIPAIAEHARLAGVLKHRYRRLMEDMRQRITNSISYNENALILGILIFSGSVLLALLSSRTVLGDFLTGCRTECRSWFLLIGCLLHSFSFASSSFIEEEHFTWYLLLTTYLVLLLFDGVETLQRQKATSLTLVKVLVFYCGPILLLRLVRMWNPAGIKWRDLGCLSGWLEKSNSRELRLFAIYGVGAIGSFIMAVEQTRGLFQKLLVIISYGLIILYRLGISESWNVLTARTVYVFCFVFILLRRFSVSTILLASLLVKLTNWPVVFLILLIQRLMAVASESISSSSLEVACSKYYLAMASYFALGNSNSLGHVDVSSGYVGFNAYSPFINGLLIIAHLYAGPLLVGASSIAPSVKDYRWLYVILCLKGVSTAAFLLIAYFQKYHLFVWSVFAPKLLYECMHMAVICCLVILIQFL